MARLASKIWGGFDFAENCFIRSYLPEIRYDSVEFNLYYHFWRGDKKGFSLSFEPIFWAPSSNPIILTPFWQGQNV